MSRLFVLTFALLSFVAPRLSFQLFDDANCDTKPLSLVLSAVSVRVDDDADVPYALKQYAMLLEHVMRVFYAECNGTYWEGEGDTEIEDVNVADYYLFTAQSAGAFKLTATSTDGRCDDGEFIDVEDASEGAWYLINADNCLINLSVEADSEWKLVLSRLKVPDLQ